jgi:dATP pyrophosphohydrolase
LATIRCEIVEVCVFKLVKSRPHYLLLQRSAGEEPYPNLWQIITGTMRHRETSVAAALRELEEETRLRAKRFWTVPFVNSFFDPANDCVQLIPVFAAEADAAQEPRLSREHQRYEWLTYPAAQKKLVWPGQRQDLAVVHDFIAEKKEHAPLVELHHP